MSIGVVETNGQVAGSYKVDVSRGQRIGRVSSEWFSRSGDERYLSLADLYAAVHGRAERSVTRIVESKAVRVEASREDGEGLSLVLRAGPNRWHRPIGVLASSPVSSAHPPPICGRSRPRSRASTCNMA